MGPNFLRLIAFAVYCSLASSAFAVAEGDLAPSFSLPQLGTTQQLHLSDYADKIVYLDFWASWCGPCRISLPEITRLKDLLGSERFVILAINVDEQEKKGIAFLQRFPVNYTVLSDSDGRVAGMYQLPGMPTSFVIDRGRISLVHQGFKPGDMEIIRLHIEELLDDAS